MPLEDHAGDIVFKARCALGLSQEAVAGAARISVNELDKFEEEGPRWVSPDYDGLAALLRLDIAKLRRVAGGWEPRPVDLERWRRLRMVTTHGNGMSVNAYLAWDETTREAAIFDTGWDAAPILEIIAEHRLQPKFLFITHSHGDHVAAIAPLRQQFESMQLRSSAPSAPEEQQLIQGDSYEVGSLRISHRPTPGHAMDGVTFVIEGWPNDAPPVAVVGDAIFAGSMGGHKNAPELARSKVKEEILALPPDTLVCAGHGPLSTVQEANDQIPFFLG